MYKAILAAALCANLAPAMCRAGDSAPSAPITSDTAAMLNQVVQIASAGQTPETQADVKKFVQDNQGSLSALLTEAVNYINQAQKNAANGGTTPGSDATAPETPDSTATPAVGASDPTASQPASPSAAPAPQVDASTTASVQPNEVQRPGNAQPANSQQSSALQTSSVQPSGGLTTGHLAGYPSLPAVDPIISVKQNTPEQAEYVQKVNAEDDARKNALKAQSEMGN